MSKGISSTEMHQYTYEDRALVESIKDRVRIPRVWHALGLEGEPATSCRAPWRKDRDPSFSVFEEGKTWKDHGTNDSGDVFNFLHHATGWDFVTCKRYLAGMAGIDLADNGQPFTAPAFTPSKPITQREEKPRELILPPLDEGTPQDWQAVATSRRLTPYTVEIAVKLGNVLFGDVCGHRSWILTDQARRCAEARRIDGKPFPEIGSLGERKAHTLKGSQKSWPVGLPGACKHLKESDWILLVEGTPDFLAALYFVYQRRNWPHRKGKLAIPVAMLGRSNHIAPDALPYFAGRNVRIFAHADADGGGLTAARGWASDIATVSPAQIDGFSFEGLSRRDGKAVSDLNDAALITPDPSSLKYQQIYNLLP